MSALETSPQTPQPIEKDYQQRIKSILTEIKFHSERDQTQLHLGPTYDSVTSQGLRITIITVYRDYLNPENQLPTRKWYLLALNQNHQVVGDRGVSLTFREFKGEKYAKAEGMIATGIRGAGLSYPIDVATNDILQREANRTGHRVTWKISNSNLERLIEARELLAEHPDSVLEARITTMEQEQVRWQAVYGPGGKLGFDDTYRKDYQPIESTISDEETPISSSELLQKILAQVE